jgi:hypothetical protein
MFNIILWTLLGILSGFFISELLDFYYYRIFNTHISNSLIFNIIIFITILSFIRGYTGNDLYTNITLFNISNDDFTE